MTTQCGHNLNKKEICSGERKNLECSRAVKIDVCRAIINFPNDKIQKVTIDKASIVTKNSFE
jgi:hypothetical protein